MKISPIILVLFLSNFSFAQNSISSAKLHLNKGEIHKAKQILEEHLESQPGHLDAISYLGDIAAFETKWDVALSHYKKLLNQDPENAEYNFKYGGVLGLKALKVSKIQAMVYIPEIKKYLEKAAKLDPSHIKSRRALVELYIKLPSILGGSTSKAQNFANQLKNISRLEASISQGFIHKESGDTDEANLQYQKAFSYSKVSHQKPEFNYLNYELGKIAADNNIELSKGLVFLDAYIKNYNYRDIHSLEWAYYRKAQIQAHLRNKIEAQKLIDKALSLRSGFEEAKVEKKRILEL